MWFWKLDSRHLLLAQLTRVITTLSLFFSAQEPLPPTLASDRHSEGRWKPLRCCCFTLVLYLEFFIRNVILAASGPSACLLPRAAKQGHL